MSTHPDDDPNGICRDCGKVRRDCEAFQKYGPIHTDPENGMSNQPSINPSQPDREPCPPDAEGGIDFTIRVEESGLTGTITIWAKGGPFSPSAEPFGCTNRGITELIRTALRRTDLARQAAERARDAAIAERDKLAQSVKLLQGNLDSNAAILRGMQEDCRRSHDTIGELRHKMAEQEPRIGRVAG